MFTAARPVKSHSYRASLSGTQGRGFRSQRSFLLPLRKTHKRLVHLPRSLVSLGGQRRFCCLFTSLRAGPGDRARSSQVAARLPQAAKSPTSNGVFTRIQVTEHPTAAEPVRWLSTGWLPACGDADAARPDSVALADFMASSPARSRRRERRRRARPGGHAGPAARHASRCAAARS
jgi:hypothetical protein